MQKVTELLSRFLHLTPKDKKVKDVAVESILHFFPTLSEAGISVELQNRILFVRGGSSLKHAIQIKKTEILEDINQKTNAGTVKDIR